MKTMTFGAVLATVGLMALTGCAADAADDLDGATSQSTAAMTRGGDTGTGGGELGGEEPTEPTIWCTAPNYVSGDECLSDIALPSGGYTITYNPCALGKRLYCNAYGACYCGTKPRTTTTTTN